MRSPFLVASLLALGLLGLAGCPNSNSIGVQVFGSVTVHCVRFSDGSPVTGANVYVSSTNVGIPDGKGDYAFTLVPVGPETFTANSAGLKGTQTATIVQDANPDITIQMQPH
ncbi:MAG TPA: hypothetical protein VII69_06910 [Candidatus Eremiobacteraceae bacterium]